MSFNNSSSLENVLMTLNSSVSIILFILSIPTAILYGICIVALLSAKEVKLQMRILLINILMARFSGRILPPAIVHLGAPANIIMDVIVCKIFYALVFTGYFTGLTSITLFSIMVYLFIKYGDSKLKWYIIISCIILSWIVSIIFGALVFIDSTAVILGDRLDTCFLYEKSKILIPTASFILSAEVIFLTTMLVFCIVTVCFVRRRIQRDEESLENPQIMKAITKVQVYLLVVSFMDAITDVFPILFQLLKSNIAATLILSNLIDILITIAPMLIPIVMIAFLKPLRDALKETKGRMCSLMCTS